MDLERKKKLDQVFGGLGVFLLKPLVRILGRTLSRDHSLNPKGDILVLKLLGGGSLLLAYPGLNSLKKTMPKDKNLILLTTKSVASFAEQLHIFDKIYTIDDSSFLNLVSGVFVCVMRIFGRIDTCIDLEIHSRGTAILSLLSGARNRLGFFKDAIYWRIGIYTHLVFYNTYSRSASFYEALIALLGVEIENIDASIYDFRNLFQSVPSNTITIGFACSGNAPERMLTPIQWAEFLLKMNLNSSVTVHLLGGVQDYSLGEQIKIQIEKATNLKCLNQSGNFALSETIKSIASSSQFLGIDSGLLHFARLLGKDAISFWGPTDPHTRLAPRTIGKDIIYYQKISCSPCVHFASTPPCLGKNRCVEAIFKPQIAAQYITWAVLPENVSSTFEIIK